jgi:hypothetical protein
MPDTPPHLAVGRLTAHAALAVILLLAGRPASAGSRAPVHARAGLDLATAAAVTWAQDATLIYLENDEPFDSHGASRRWGYLFYSAALDKARGYSVRDGRIVEAEDLAMKFDAPPIAGEWIDSAAAYTIADEGPARRFRHEHDARLDSMVLLRGALEADQPDRITWMLVFSAPNLPSLFVVLDASDGRVLRTWRG